MNYSFDKVTTPKGKAKVELRLWEEGRGAKQLKRRFDSRKDAQNFLDKLLREGRAVSDEMSRTFGPEYAYWRAKVAQDFAPGWRKNLDGYWRESKDLLENARLRDLQPRLDELRSRWAELSQKTINNKMGFIYAVLNFSVEEKRISHNPLGSYRKPRSQDPDIDFWERQEAESFLEFLEPGWRADAIFTVLNTAIRAGELWALRPSDLKRERSTMRVSRQFNRVSHEFAATKGKKNRSVPMNDLVSLRLAGYSGNLIFSVKGKPVCHDVFREWFDEQVTAWGGKRITFHGLRHTAATLMLLSGVDVRSLQEIMGHEDIKTTMRYVHALGDSAERAAKKYSISGKSNVLSLADYG